MSSYLSTDTCKHIFFNLFFFTTICVNDENEAFFCALHSQDPKGLSKSYLHTRDTDFAPTKATFPIVLMDRKTGILLDDIQLIDSLGYSIFLIYFIYLQGK